MSSDKLIDIGFIEEIESWRLHPRFFPSKVGGKPAWLQLKDIPKLNELACGICNETMIFLCQIYAPFEDKDECFHRTVFIFVCKKGTCCRPNLSTNFKIFRSQLGRLNDFYPSEPLQEVENEVFSTSSLPALCAVCGLRGPSHCSKCKKINYCGRAHQVLDWQKEHKEMCGSNIQASTTPNKEFLLGESGKSALFNEFELIVEEESEEVKSSKINVDSEMEKLKKLRDNKKDGTLNDVPVGELEQYAGAEVEDKVFNKFSKRVSRHPDQVLRYDRGGQPLWITSKPIPGESGIPNCAICNGKRKFEFQIMPQLLNFLNVGLEVNSIDWGVLSIYTCEKSCDESPAYKEEYIFKQDITNEINS